MTRRQFLHRSILGMGSLSLMGLAGCSRMVNSARDPNVDYYTCTMHPSVRSQDPKGKCPICSMDLVPVMKKGAAREVRSNDSGPENREFHVPVERQQQIGVTYASVARKPLHDILRTVGVVVPDKTRRWEFVARVDGYVQKLEVSSPGELVEEGQPLLTIYSPDLLAAERELVNLLGTRDTGTARLLDAARSRLKQWNLTTDQIAELEKTKVPSETVALYSPFRGVVESVPIEQGRKVASGERLVTATDLSVVWVWAEFYEDEVSLLARGQTVRISSQTYPGKAFMGRIGLIDPFLSEAKRTARVRIDIPNPDFKLRPQMYVDVELSIDRGEALAIPVSAMLPTGKHTLVFVDRGEGRLEPRAIGLGRKYGDDYEVLSGLEEGERVVASANFLIDAESKIQGAAKAFEENTSGEQRGRADIELENSSPSAGAVAK